jgi:hypothetical protein
MKERFITNDEIVYWVELAYYFEDKPIYKVELGWYLGSYKLGCSDNVKHIVTSSITSCVVKHVDQYYIDKTAAEFAAQTRTLLCK